MSLVLQIDEKGSGSLPSRARCFGGVQRVVCCGDRKEGRGDFLRLAEERKLWKKEWEMACGCSRGEGRWGEAERRRGLKAAGALAQAAGGLGAAQQRRGH
jgi:hypothetical protein